MAVLLFAFNAVARAQENPSPAAAAAPAEAKTEMQKWIEATDAQWQAVFQRDVTEVREAEVKKLMLQYLNMLEEAIGRASKAGDLKGALALRDEQKRFGETQLFPEKDDAADTAAALKEIRTAIRAHLAKLDTDTAVRAKALHAKYDQVLAQAQLQLTQAKRLDDALLVQTKRDEVAAAWMTPAAAAAGNANAPATPPAAAVQKPPAPPKVPFGTKAGPVFAKVEAEEVKLVPLSKGEQHTSRGPVIIMWESIPESLQGYQFTKAKSEGVPLRFTVLTDGLVYLACTTRFGLKLSDATTEAELKRKGWKKHKDLVLHDYSPQQTGRQVWNVYSRECKAGEKFTYRNEQYLAPILLVK